MKDSPIHDTEAATGRSAAQLGDLGWVALGGACGTLARTLLGSVIGEFGGLPVGILVINVVGALLLGVLLESLALWGSDRGLRRKSRLLLGTGVLGGFTTYSLLATDVAGLLLHGSPLLGLAYGLTTLVLGGGATWLGMLLAGVTHRRSRGIA